jgi:hypothetical protein
MQSPISSSVGIRRVALDAFAPERFASVRE